MNNSNTSAPNVERAVLGSIYLFPEKQKVAFKQLDRNNFTTYKPIFDAFKFFWDEVGEIDLSEVEDHLARHDYKELSTSVISLTQESSVNLENSIQSLKRLTRKRKIRNLSLKITKCINKGDSIEEPLMKLSQLRKREQLNEHWFELINPYLAPVKPLHWIIEGFAAKGMITILGGEAGSGKSILTQYLLQLRNKQSILNCENGKAVFLSGMDSSETELRRRAKSIGSGKGLFTVSIPDDIIPFITNESFKEEIKDKVIENDIDCIVFDTLADYHSGNLYDADDANNTMKAFRQLARVTEVAIILITHTRKSADVKTKYSVNDIADSRIFGTKSDFVFAIKSEYQNSINLIELQCLKSRSPKPLSPKRISIEFDERKGKLLVQKTDKNFYSEDKKLKKELEIKERQKEAWELKQEGLSNREIAEKLGVSHVTIGKDLKNFNGK